MKSSLKLERQKSSGHEDQNHLQRVVGSAQLKGWDRIVDNPVDIGVEERNRFSTCEVEYRFKGDVANVL